MKTHQSWKHLPLLAATTLVVAACSSSNDPPPTPPPAEVNTRPTITVVADQTVDQDTVLGPVSFGVADQESDPSTLKVEANIVEGVNVVPADGVAISGAGAERMITLTPYEAATGTATIGLRVTDVEGSMATRAFKVTVNAKSASVRDVALSTFAKAATDDPTAINGFTFAQDADDTAFAALIPAEDP
jgi:hypothetical protein